MAAARRMYPYGRFIHPSLFPHLSLTYAPTNTVGAGALSYNDLVGSVGPLAHEPKARELAHSSTDCLQPLGEEDLHRFQPGFSNRPPLRAFSSHLDKERDEAALRARRPGTSGQCDPPGRGQSDPPFQTMSRSFSLSNNFATSSALLYNGSPGPARPPNLPNSGSAGAVGGGKGGCESEAGSSFRPTGGTRVPPHIEVGSRPATASLFLMCPQSRSGLRP